MTKKSSAIVTAIIVVLIIIGFIVIRPTSTSTVRGVGEPTGFDNVSLTGGLKVGVPVGDVSLPVGGDGSIYAATGITVSGLNSTSTLATSGTLLQSDIYGYSLISITPNTSTVTYTLPASSTLTSFIPRSGDVRVIYVQNASTTSGVNVVINAGVGETVLKAVTSTSTSILAGGVAKFEFVRLPSSNIAVIFTNAI